MSESSSLSATKRAMAAANFALRHRWLIIIIPLLAVAFSAFSSLRGARSFTSSARFMTQQVSRTAAPAGLAAQLGLNVSPSADPAQVPEFYTELLTSMPVVERTAKATYDITTPDGQVRRQTLVDYYGSLDAAVGTLRGSISSSIAPKVGIISFSVTARTASLAQQIANELLREVDEFNRQRRQSRSVAERRFTQGRLATADSELKAAETNLMEFYVRNRGFERSPELKFQEDRLGREVARRQQLYASLAQAYEQARIEEVRDTPVITVLEEPSLPKFGNSRNTIPRALVAGATALVLALALALALELPRRVRFGESDELTEMKSLGREFAGDVKNPSRIMRRIFANRPNAPAPPGSN